MGLEGLRTDTRYTTNAGITMKLTDVTQTQMGRASAQTLQGHPAASALCTSLCACEAAQVETGGDRGVCERALS